jgi:tetratricopeptide (TPR) repeat protein
MNGSSRLRGAPFAAFALMLLLTGCNRGKPADASLRAGSSPVPQQQASDAGSGATNDTARLDADIERLERQAERNPADEDTRDELARAYVRRGDAERTSGKLNEALADYQRALRLDPDNNEAQNNAAATKEQVGGGEQQGENGEPAPLPITPNVADEDKGTAAKPTPTPKKQ